MADPYTSKYSGAQIDAAVKAIGAIPAVYVSYKEYNTSITALKTATDSMVTSFNNFFIDVIPGDKTFKQLFDEERAQTETRLAKVENDLKVKGVFFEEIKEL